MSGNRLKIFQNEYMKGKNVYILYCLSIFLFVTFLGCGSSQNEGDEGEGTVFDTVPVFEKDTFLYPLATRSSSYMFPEVNFGDVRAIDGDLGTAWQTIPGLVTGEYIEFDFDSLLISGFELFVGTELRFSRFKNIKLYTEGNLMGTFPVNGRIPVGKKVNVLRIELGETEGVNKVDIPFVIDSTRNVETSALSAESIYSSKAASLYEVAFFDEKNQRIPLRSLQVKKALMNFYGTTPPQQINNARMMFDGRRGFGWKGPAEPEEKTLLFSFAEDQIINGIYFPFRENLNVTKIGFRLRKRPLPEYDVVYKSGNGIFIPLKNTLKGKNFELVILETQNDEAPMIPELLFHDGSRLFSIYSDSLEFYQKQRVDSSRQTPIAGYLDGRVTTNEDYKEYAHPLNVIFSKTKTVKDTLPQKSVQTQTVFRLCSNGTFTVNETRTEQTYGTQPAFRRSTRTAEGYWLIKQKNGDEARITCYAGLRETESISRAGKPAVESTHVKSVEFDATLVRNYISFSGYFSGMTTGY